MPTLADVPALLLNVVIRIGAAILIIVVGRWLGHVGEHWLKRALGRTEITPSLIALFSTLVHYGILLLAIMTALAVLGVPVAAILSISGVAIILLGIALKESLADLAATVIFLLFHPFRVGELVDANAVLGTVQEIQLFTTTLRTGDNKLVSVPNGQIQQNNLINYSRLGVLGADVLFTVSYTDDLLRAKQVIEEIVGADSRVLADPPAVINVRELSENGVIFLARPFVKVEDYGTLQADLRERVKLRFDQEGIRIPVPQREVRVVQSQSDPKFA